MEVLRGLSLALWWGNAWGPDDRIWPLFTALAFFHGNGSALDPRSTAARALVGGTAGFAIVETQPPRAATVHLTRH